MDVRRNYRTWLKSVRALVIAGGVGLLSTQAIAEDATNAYSQTGLTLVSAVEDADQPVTVETAVAESVQPLTSGITTPSAPTGIQQVQDVTVFDYAPIVNPDDSPFTVGGWVQYGYYSDADTPNALGLNFNDNATNAFIPFAGTRQNQKGGLHQAWVYAEKVADGSNGLDWGFRVDAMYGLDADDTQAFGEPAPQDHWDNSWDSGIYGFAMPQLYAELAGEDWSVKIGHFYTLVGYEVVPAPDNFFFSHAYTMFNNEPFTHTGFIATVNASDDVELYGGWVAGWDTGFDRFSDGDRSKGNAFLGGFSVGLTDDITATYITTIGDWGLRGEGYSHSIVIDVALTDNLNYVFQTDLVEGTGGSSAIPGVNPFVPEDHQFAINQYLFYNVNEYVSAGLRAEWWSSSTINSLINSNNLGVAAGGGNVDVYEITAGLNIRPLGEDDGSPFTLVIRPEVRHDWSEGATGVFIGPFDADWDFTTFACDVIIGF